ncbi:MAG: transcription antitermination factor NusB [Woeseia sp.]|nr:transcription antitermination factor NusB [Woeseia sp.]MBT8095527.1 transcription antitermination factor NusB [Woeseia sp.]
MQVAGHDGDEILRQFHDRPEFSQVEAAFFDEAIREICASLAECEADIARYADRPLDQLDPVERGILLLGMFELRNRADIPFRVVINEAVNLSKRFGASDSHKFVNGLLDRAAPVLRAAEKGGA